VHWVSIGSTEEAKGMHNLDIAHHLPAFVGHWTSIVLLRILFERHDRDFVLHDREKLRPYLSIVRPLKAFVTHDRNPVTLFRAKVVHDVSKEQLFEDQVSALTSRVRPFRSIVAPLRRKVCPLRSIVQLFRNNVHALASFSANVLGIGIDEGRRQGRTAEGSSSCPLT
jgi:hypothetical protein